MAINQYSFVLGQFPPLEELGDLITRNVNLARVAPKPVAVGSVPSGAAFLGVFVELPDHEFIHPVQFLVAILALHSEEQLAKLAVSADGSIFDVPCVHCLEFLKELRQEPETLVLTTATAGGSVNMKPLSTLTGYVRPEHGLLDQRHNGLTFSSGDTCRDSDRCGHLRCTALRAANRSYAPYTRSMSGVALKDTQGVEYAGWCLEADAHGHSGLGPLHVALIDFVANGTGLDFTRIVEAVLVEKEGLRLGQEAKARKILQKIAPRCRFTVHHCI